MSTEDELFASFEAQLSEIIVEDAVDVSKLTDFDLMTRLEEIDNELTKNGKLDFGSTREARDLHSLRGAVRMEQLKREGNGT